MKRIVRKLTMPTDTASAIFSIPAEAVVFTYDGGYYFDYIDTIGGDPPPDAIYVGEMQPDGTIVDLVGAGLQDTFPQCFMGWDRKQPAPEKPVIELPRHIVLIMLTQAGLLSRVQEIVTSMAAVDPKVQIAFDNFPTAHSNDPFVHLVLGANGAGLTEDQIYQLFVSAKTPN